LSEADLLGIERLLRDFNHARDHHDPAAMAQHHYAFHEAIVSHSDQYDVIATWRSVIARARLYTSEWISLDSQQPLFDEHGRIITACRNHDIHHAQQSLDNALRIEAGAMTSEADVEMIHPHHDIED
jgi:DNA-binding GntR family transcriptional regulator